MKTDESIIKGLIAISDVARVTPRTIQNWYARRHDNGLPVVKRGGIFYADRTALTEWLTGSTESNPKIADETAKTHE